MQITVLCKVVDNFGDIGVVYRLTKQLKKINPENQINLVTDNLDSFNKICSLINPVMGFQTVEGLNIYNWNAYDFCYEKFSQNDGELMPVILECFQCGRPDWMERILFEDKLERIVHIIMIDYLTAEKYAEDFHCLKSLTRSAKVQKVNFMPGFTDKTGGLIIDEAWNKAFCRNNRGSVLVFTYERDWKPLAESLNQLGKKILVAQGRGMQSFIDAWNEIHMSKTTRDNRTRLPELSYLPHSPKHSETSIEVLPYINQDEWDKVMKDCSILIIRGEESMSRACLSGIPFIWHAYPQSDEYQLVKVNALLERIKCHFSQEDFSIIEKVWLCFNSPESEVSPDEFKKACDNFFSAADRLSSGFYDFASSLRKNGDLCANLMTFIEKIDII